MRSLKIAGFIVGYATLITALASALGRWLRERDLDRRVAQVMHTIEEEPDFWNALLLDQMSERHRRANTLSDLLSLIGEDIDADTIETWDDDCIDEVERWAAIEHLYAADNDDLTRLPRPECFR